MGKRLRRWCTKVAATSAGFAATAMYSSPARGSHEDDINFDIGAYLSYNFGSSDGKGGGFGVGVQARSYLLTDRYCSNDPLGFFGASARFGLVGFTQPQLIVASQGGVMVEDNYSAAGELGIGYRWGDYRGLQVLVGTELGASFMVARGNLDPTRHGELALDLGFRAPSIDSRRYCYVIGRALRIDGGIADRPGLRVRGEACALGEQNERGVAAWCDRARTEWASVPAFFELADQLIAVGAPAELVDRAYVAASEEVRHAIDSAQIAAVHRGGAIAIDSTRHVPRAVASGVDGVVRLAIESWIDGCVGEGLAASAAFAEAKIDEAPERIRSVQRAIARDEAGHAELAWDILEWALEREPDAVRAALVAARQVTNAQEDAQGERDLRAFGCLDEAELANVSSNARAAADTRLTNLLA